VQRGLAGCGGVIASAVISPDTPRAHAPTKIGFIGFSADHRNLVL
jgi:hypothetical protein